MDFLEFPKINKNAYLENCNFQKKKKKVVFLSKSISFKKYLSDKFHNLF